MTLSPATSRIAASVVLFDSTLAAPAAAIDTGANGIDQGYDVLEVLCLLRTVAAVVGSSATVRFNNDSGAVYDAIRLTGLNGAASSSTGVAATADTWNCPGANAQAGACAAVRCVIPGYAQTSFFKQALILSGYGEDTVADVRADYRVCQYRSTAAITRMAVTGAANLAAGSRLLILGL